jgi:hypothetical protein
MILAITELSVISELGKGNNDVSEIAKVLKISASQAYRVAQKLSQKGILTPSKRILQPETKTHVNLLLNLLSKAVNLSNPFSGTGLQIYAAMIEPRRIKEVEMETGLHRRTIFKKISQGKKMSLLLLEDRKYRINEKIWPDVKDFLIELKKYEERIDPRVPVNSIIYFKNNKEIIFSTKEDIDAEKTAFSAYDIELLLTTNFYCLPRRNLTIKDIFKHSIYVAEKDPEIRYLTFITLFYIKHKKELSKIKHPIIENITKILSGEKISGYPTLEDIKDRAKVYKLEV